MTAAAAVSRSASVFPVATNPGYDTWKPLRSPDGRPSAPAAFACPRPSAGNVTSRRYRSVVKPWTSRPSATSPATSAMSGPTAARNTFGGPNGFGPGLKKGVIKVKV